MPEFQTKILKYQRPLISDELYRLTGYRPVSNVPSLSSMPIANGWKSSETATTARSVPSPSEIAADEIVCQVQCKLVHRFCTHFPNSPFTVYVGCIVIISTEGESMYDIGVVTKMLSRDQFEARRSFVRPSNDREESEIRRILRLASSEECKLLPSKHKEEEEVLSLCQDYVVNVYRLPMVVYGAEFQFDRRLLTFYYTSDSRADYRDLVRVMFNQFNVRIKMRKTNQCKPFTPVPFASAALRTGIVNSKGR